MALAKLKVAEEEVVVERNLIDSISQIHEATRRVRKAIKARKARTTKGKQSPGVATVMPMQQTVMQTIAGTMQPRLQVVSLTLAASRARGAPGKAALVHM